MHKSHNNSSIQFMIKKNNILESQKSEVTVASISCYSQSVSQVIDMIINDTNSIHDQNTLKKIPFMTKMQKKTPFIIKMQ